jgi:hypothetical protein
MGVVNDACDILAKPHKLHGLGSMIRSAYFIGFVFDARS